MTWKEVVATALAMIFMVLMWYGDDILGLLKKK
jgi:hypothetical protein